MFEKLKTLITDLFGDREHKLKASKYLGIQKTEGVETALNVLIGDLGSQGKVLFHPASRANDNASVQIDDVQMVISGTQMGGTIYGDGKTKEAALADLFNNLVHPGKYVPKGHGRIGVGPFGHPQKIFRIVP
jgi:hypothetical protein